MVEQEAKQKHIKVTKETIPKIEIRFFCFLYKISLLFYILFYLC